jgi:hypothetical protein
VHAKSEDSRLKPVLFEFTHKRKPTKIVSRSIPAITDDRVQLAQDTYAMTSGPAEVAGEKVGERASAQPLGSPEERIPQGKPPVIDAPWHSLFLPDGLPDEI